MGIPDGAHTHGSGGSGLGPVVLVIIAVALLGPAVATAAVELLHVLVIVAAVTGGIVLAGGAALVAFRVRQERQEPPQVVHTASPPHRLGRLRCPQSRGRRSSSTSTCTWVT